MTKRLLALAITLAGLISTAHANTLPVGGAITGHALSGALFSAADGYASASNPATAALSDGFGDIEFVSDDGNLFFDFKSDGTLDLYGLANGLSNRFDFDFADLGGRLFAAAFASPVAGLSLEVLDADTLRLTLDRVDFAADGSPFSARLVVPEPASLPLVALALFCAVLARRRAL
jgi:hypothetical protein